jgi:hypothetical protein
MTDQYDRTKQAAHTEWHKKELIYHFDRQVAKIPKAVKAAKKIEKKRGQRTRWGE